MSIFAFKSYVLIFAVLNARVSHNSEALKFQLLPEDL